MAVIHGTRGMWKSVVELDVVGCGCGERSCQSLRVQRKRLPYS